MKMKECFICKEEESKKKLQIFPCNVCVEGCWYICKHCQDKIIKNFDKCPVCNTSISQIKIDIKNNDSEEENTREENTREENITYYQKISNIFEKCFNNFVLIMVIIFTITINIALFLLLLFIFMLLCNNNCNSCIGFSIFFSLINYIIIIFLIYSVNEWGKYQFIFGLLIFLNGIFVFITSGIKYECSGQWNENLEIIEDTVVCHCEFKPQLSLVLVFGMIVGCILCNCHFENNNDED